MLKSALGLGLRHLGGVMGRGFGPRAIAIALGAGALALTPCLMEAPAFASGMVPGEPTGVVVSPGTSSAHVSWTAPKNDGGSAITGYTVTANPGDKQCTVGEKTLCTVHDLTNGDTYSFSIRARNANGESTASAVMVLKLGVPLAPTDVTTSNWTAGLDYPNTANWSVQINWKAPADDGNSITKYTVVSNPGSRSCSTSAHTYCRITLLSGGSYTFKVTATNARGVGAESVQSAPFVYGAIGTTSTIGDNFWSDGFSTDGSHVWVADWVDSTVVELSTSDQVVQTITVGNGNLPQDASSDGAHVWVADEGSNTVTELEASDGSIVQTIPVGDAPFAISSDGTHVWVANSGDNTVTELDASDGSVVRTIPVGTAPESVFSDGTHVWVGGSALSELDASDGSVVRSIPIAHGAGAIRSDGTHVWVGGVSSVTELSVANGSVVRTIPAVFGDETITSDGSYVWLGGEDGVTEVKASTGALVKVVETADVNPSALVSSYGPHVWIVNPTWGPPTDLQSGYITEFTG
jgi:YVTN family beta-propeller protein